MMRNFRYLIFLIFVILLPAKLSGQKILDPEFNPPDKRFDNFLVKGGNAGQKSISILIDSKGFIWSGTETGLYRYDGTRYVEYGVNRGNNNGFKGFTVTNIFEDRKSTIWIGTSEALNKLDQTSGTFRYFSPDSAGKGTNGNYIRSINEDREGILWIMTGRDIYSFDPEDEQFTRFTVDSLSWYPKNYFYTVEVQHFAEDSQGNKWFVTNRGLYLYDYSRRIFSMILPHAEKAGSEGITSINCVAVDNNGTVWAGTSGGGLIRWNNSSGMFERVNIQPEGKYIDRFNNITTLLTAGDGTIWCFGEGSFSIYNPKTGNCRNYEFIYKHRTVYESPGSPVWIDQAFQHNDGTIWFLNKQAGLILRFDPGAEKLSLYRTPAFVVYQCIMDKTGSFWFTCIRNNIYRLVTDRIPFVVNSDVLNNTSSTSQTFRNGILEEGKSGLWFIFNRGTYTTQFSGISSRMLFNPFRFPDGDTIKESGFKDSKGNLWFATVSGKITRYHPETNSFRNYIIPNTSTDIKLFMPSLIREDKPGNIWIASPLNGLFRIPVGDQTPEKVLDFNRQSGDQNQKMIMDFMIDGKGNFWILTAESLLLFRGSDMKLTDFTNYGDGIFTAFRSNIRVREDSHGNIWILNSRSGLHRFDPQNDSFTKVYVMYEGPDADYYDLLVDRKDRLWVAHNSGITILSPEEKSPRLIRTPKLQYDLQSFQTSTGYVLYVNDYQLLIFNENPPENNEVPPVFITRISVSGKDKSRIINNINELETLKRIDLPFGQNTLSIEFAALNYLNPDQNMYRYFMTKRDKDTLLVSQGSSAEYKSIPPGHYRFWVTGSNNDGLWNPSGVSLDIRIHPPWYRSVAALVLYVVLLLALISIYIRKRTDILKREKARLEAEVRARTSELELKNRQLAELDRVKTHYFTDISHEIRTPLTMILGPLENLSREEMLSSRMSGMIDLIRRNAQRLMHLVNQLLDISKLDAGKMKITLTEDDIVKCMRILIYEYLSMAESKHIRYVADLPGKSLVTWFDRDKTEKIITNILSNAFKYTPRNGTIQCNVRIETNPDGKFRQVLRINVTDSGPGISKENQEKIFDRFYRIEGHHEINGYGTGIGLSLVQEFVSLLHGEITVTSNPGKGSEFSVLLPLGKDHLSADEYIVTESSIERNVKTDAVVWKEKYSAGLQSPEEKGKLKILLIEDNEDLRNYIKDTLAEKYYVLEANNGKAGINTAFTMMPDLIVSDIMMPDLDGITLCSTIKNDEITSHIPVIMLTAKASAEEKLEGLKSGADDYIIKPFNMPELVTRISNLLALRDKLRQKYSKLNLLSTGPGGNDSVDDRFMNRIIKIINENLEDNSFDVGSLQEITGMSRMHLTRKLKILTGLTPGMLIRNIRLEKAAGLIARKAGNIAGIANSVGMENPSNFTKAFRSYFGVSPKDYVKH